MDPGAYMVAVVAVTSLWVYLLRHKSFTFLALAMFFPGVAAVVSELVSGDLPAFLSVAAFGTRVSSPFGGVFSPNLIASVCLAGATAFAFPLLCAVASVLVGWGRIVPPSPSPSAPVHAHNRALLLAFARAAGEELGWRCWLLPRLMVTMPPLYAFLLSGVAWGGFHVAVMILLSFKNGNPEPIATVVLQCLSCVLSSSVFGAVAAVGGFSLWAPALLHFAWNQFNPFLLGSVYSNTEGVVVRGKPVLINGEGAMGCIIGALATVAIVNMMT